jgi:hypothetical protein
MPRKLPLLTLVALASALIVAQAAAKDIIPAGTVLQCTVDEPNFSSKTAMVGDPVLCHLGPLGAFGHSVFPRGAMLSGHLQDYKDPGHFVGKGWIELEFDRLVLPNAEVLPLSTKVISAPHLKVDKQGDIHGKGHPKRDAIGWMIPVLWPIKILTLPARGPYPALKGETRLALRLMEDVEVPLPTSARNAVPMPPWANPSSAIPSSQVFRPASYTERVSGEPVSEQASSGPLTVIALKGGTAFLAREYWLQGGQMHCISEDGDQKLFSLEKVDLNQTVHVNQERKVEFVLQSRDAPVEQ